MQTNSDVEVSTPPPRRTWVEGVESFVGGVFSILLALSLIIWGIWLMGDPPSGSLHLDGISTAAICAVTVIFDGWLLANVCEGFFRSRIPLALWVAQRLPRVPVILRPVVAITWLAHGVTLGFVAYRMHMALANGLRTGETSLEFELWMFALVFGMTFLCNIYVLLAIQSISRSSPLQHLFWRWRFAFDVALASSVFVI